MKNKILLITSNLVGVKDGLNRIQPPLGLMLMASTLLKKNYEVKILDTALEGWSSQVEIDNDKISIGMPDHKIEEYIRDYKPDIVGISVLFSNLVKSSHIIAKIVKKINKKIKVVLGGNHITNSHLDYMHQVVHPGNKIPLIHDLEDENIDCAMTGESDLNFLKLVEAILNSGDLKVVSGILFRESYGKYFYISSERIAKLDVLPKPARHLVNMEGYFKIGAFHSAKSKSNRVLSVMCSRGCPEKCTFCTTPDTWGADVRWREISEIVEEIKEGIKNYNIGEIQFEDDTLTARKKNLVELCKELEKIGLPWCTPNGTKANYHMATQPELYKQMYEAGCYQLSLAGESGVQRVMDEIILKRLKIDQIKPAIDNAKKAGLLVHTFWILGYPGETYDEMCQTIDFAMDTGSDSFSFSILSPLPGTPIYRKVVKENLWWPEKNIKDIMYRSSLVKVDGFTGPKDFEDFVTNANIKANLLLKKNDPQRFNLKYKTLDEKELVKQT